MFFIDRTGTLLAVKRLALLVFLLLSSVAPGWAVDISVNSYAALIDALSGNYDTIVIAADISVDATLVINRRVTLKAAKGVHPTLRYTGTDTAVDCSVIKCEANNVDLTLEDLTIRDGKGCQIKDKSDTVHEYGGGLYVSGDVTVTVTNCAFINNSAGIGGGIYVYKGKETTAVTNCAFTGNTADTGGGMRVDESATSSVTNCTFTQNTAETGGGMYVSGSTAVVANCTFTGNTATHEGDGGGGGGISIEGSASADIINCTFAGNTAVYGAEVRCDSTFNAINTIFWNIKKEYIYNNGTTLKLYNCAYKEGAVYGKEVDDIENFKNLSWDARVSMDAEVEGVTHTIFPLTKEDKELINKGRTSLSEVVGETVAAIVEPELAYDQLGKLGAPYKNDYDETEFYATRDASPDIGAIEYIEVSVTTGEDSLPDGTEGTAYKETTLKPTIKIKTDSKEIEANPERSELTVNGLPGGLSYNVSEDKSIKITGTPTEAGTFDVVVTALCGVYSANETLRLTVKAAEGKPEQKKLVSLDVTLSDNRELTVTEGCTGSLTLSADVRAGYSDGWAKDVLTSGYDLKWDTASGDLSGYGMSFDQGTGTLMAGTMANAGTYLVPVTATAISGDITGFASAAVKVTISKDVKPEPGPEPKPEPESEPEKGQEKEAEKGTTPALRDLTIGDETVPYLPLEEPDPELTQKVSRSYSELIGDLPPGTQFFSDMTKVHVPNTNGLNSFIESINEEGKEEAREITAVLSPLQVDEPGVYFMKVAASEDQKETLKGGYDLQYHVKPYSADAEADVKLAEDTDNSHGILVDANGEKLSSSIYNGEDDLYVLVYFAQAKTPYAQYLTMEAESKHSDGPTSNKGSGGGCDTGVSSGLMLWAFLALIPKRDFLHVKFRGI